MLPSFLLSFTELCGKISPMDNATRKKEGNEPW
jgi:hypothetical protein